MNKFTNIDIRKVSRGSCRESQCECTEYIRKLDSDTESFLLCLYCGHPPTKHNSILNITKETSPSVGMYTF